MVVRPRVAAFLSWRAVLQQALHVVQVQHGLVHHGGVHLPCHGEVPHPLQHGGHQWVGRGRRGGGLNLRLVFPPLFSPPPPSPSSAASWLHMVLR